MQENQHAALILAATHVFMAQHLNAQLVQDGNAQLIYKTQLLTTIIVTQKARLLTTNVTIQIEALVAHKQAGSAHQAVIAL